MADIYRKSSLEKLSSPEQLDRMIVITSPSFWIAIAGAALIIAIALIWSIVGKLPEKISANGIYINDGGIYSVYSNIGGTVSAIDVAVGENVENGTVVVTVADEDTQNQIAQLQGRIDSVEAITLNSINDAVTSDNKELVDLKTQLETLSLQLEQNKEALSDRRGEYGAQKKLLERYEIDMTNAKINYYNSLDTDANNNYQQDLSDTQSAYSLRQQTYDSVVSNYYLPPLQAYKAALETANPSSAPVAALTSATDIVNKAILSADPGGANISVASPTAIDPTTAASYYAALLTEWDKVEEAKKTYVAPAAAALSAAKAAYDNAKTRFDNYSSVQTQLTVKQQMLQNEYSMASQNYNNQFSTVMGLESTVNQLKTQVDNDELALAAQTEQTGSQFASAKAAMLNTLERELENFTRNLEKTYITAEHSGVVSEIVVQVGSVIGQGSELMKLSKATEAESRNVIICYIPVTSGKKVTPGMKAMIYPSTVNKQEYGHMEGTVLNVDAYVTSSASMKSQLGDETLVNSFLNSGPVVAVTCEIKEDPATASGYFWSSDKGADIMLSEGTMVTADVVVSEKAPITMLIPLLKEKLTITAAQKTDGNEG